MELKGARKLYKRKITIYCLCQKSIRLFSIMKQKVSEIQEEGGNIEIFT